MRFAEQEHTHTHGRAPKRQSHRRMLTNHACLSTRRGGANALGPRSLRAACSGVSQGFVDASVAAFFAAGFTTALTTLTSFASAFTALASACTALSPMASFLTTLTSFLAELAS